MDVNIMPNLRPCPICDGTERQMLHRQRFFEGILGDGYDVVVCNHCGAGFADGIPLQLELDRYYAEQSKYTSALTRGAESEHDLRRFEILVEHISPYLPKDASILDIGCATGGLLSVFKRRGYQNLLGADPSPVCAEAALRLHDITVRTVTISQLTGWKEKFDLVISVGVLEHIREARAAIDKLRSRLAPAGYLFIAVPDVEGFSTCRNAAFQQFSMEHLNFFSAPSLSRLMASSGFVLKAQQQYKVEWRQDIDEPILSAVFTEGVGIITEKDNITKGALIDYIAKSTSADMNVVSRIQDLVASQEPIWVWGTGALARRLLTEANLVKANILGFVDSYARAETQLLAGKKIIYPDAIRSRSERILICSQTFEHEIIQSMREHFGLTNAIITLC